MGFIAAYDCPDAGEYERNVLRIARTWLSLTKATYSVQGIVNRIVDEFSVPPPEDYGCGWIELQEKFKAWAITEQWLNPDGTPPGSHSR